MTTPQPLTENTLDTIKDDLIFGYHNNNGEKQYPNVKEAAKWHKVSYDSLRKRTGKWNWQQKRQDHIDKVNRKVAQKKKEEEISETEAEAIIVEDAKFNLAANKLRRAAVKEIENVLNGTTYRSVGYVLMNIGRALESAQKISKTAAGEPSEISQVLSNDKSVVNEIKDLFKYAEKGNEKDDD